MRLLTFNLWHGLSPTNLVAFEALEPEERLRLRLERQVEVIRQAAPDICFFQEVNPVQSRAPALGRALNLETTFQPDLVGLKLFGLGLPYNLNSGLAILARNNYALKKIEGFSLTRSGPSLVHAWGSWQVKEERFALFSAVEVPGLGMILVVNTHLHHGLELTEDFRATIAEVGEELDLPSDTLSELSARLSSGNKRRHVEVARLLRHVDQLGKDYDMVIIGGDFNCSPTSDLSEMLRTAGYRDAWAEAHPDDPGYSFDHTKNEANHILQSQFPLTVMVEDLTFEDKIKETLLKVARVQEYRPRRIDYLWTKTFGRKFKIVGAELIGQPDADGLAPSDHFGVVVDVEGE